MALLTLALPSNHHEPLNAAFGLCCRIRLDDDEYGDSVSAMYDDLFNQADAANTIGFLHQLELNPTINTLIVQGDADRAMTAAVAKFACNFFGARFFVQRRLGDIDMRVMTLLTQAANRNRPAPASWLPTFPVISPSPHTRA
ncbi:MAG: hypothetical protein H7232_02935 [Aeromicrobium sp.]|nr:hypothetical protein [Burkholderiales bacterium]